MLFYSLAPEQYKWKFMLNYENSKDMLNVDFHIAFQNKLSGIFKDYQMRSNTMPEYKIGDLTELIESKLSLKKYSVIVETCSGASDSKVRECANTVLSMGCRDIHFTGFDCNRWHCIFDEEDSANFDSNALTSDMHDAFSLYSCKNKVYILYQSRFIKKRLNQNIKEMAKYIELFYEDNGVVLMTESSSEKTDHFSFTVKIYKNSISLEKIVQIGERVLMREMDVKCIKTTIIDENKIILDVYREVDL